jgi:hypothetical protein
MKTTLCLLVAALPFACAGVAMAQNQPANTKNSEPITAATHCEDSLGQIRLKSAGTSATGSGTTGLANGTVNGSVTTGAANSGDATPETSKPGHDPRAKGLSRC